MRGLSPTTLALISLATAGWAVSFGVGTQGASHWLADRNAGDTVIGLLHSIYYLGVALASFVVPYCTRRLGIRCAILGLVLSGVTVALFPFTDSLFLWFTLRFISGVACAMSLIPLETLVSHGSPPEQRTQNFGYYAVALTLGGALGIGAGLAMFVPGETFIFVVGGSITSASSIWLWLMPTAAIADHGPTVRLKISWRGNWLSFGTAWSQGFLEGGMIAFMALYLEMRGIAQEFAGVLMGVTMIGVIAFQVPVAWLGDRLGRLPVLLGCYAFVLAGLGMVPYCTSLYWLGFWLFTFGACSGAMYPLGLSMLGERVPEAALARAYGLYLAMECVGSQIGAAAMGRARDLWGPNAMFGVGFAAVLGVLTSWWIVRERRPVDASMPEVRRAA